MNTYWKDNTGDDESFWEHEWGKHGTCISTLKPSCYTGYTPGAEAVDFFDRTVALFKTLPSYDWLSAAGIVPSSSATYTLSAMQAALTKGHGKAVTINCASGAVDEIWYHYEVKGSVQDGTFQAADPVGSGSTCPSSGIKYLPKSGSAAPTTSGGGSTATTSKTSASTSATSTGTGTAFTGKGTLNVNTSGAQKGCLISSGAWYTTGTCASFTATASGEF